MIEVAALARAEKNAADLRKIGGEAGGTHAVAVASVAACSATAEATASSIFWNVRRDGNAPFAMRCNVSGLTLARFASAPVSKPVIDLAVASQLGSR